MPRKSLHRRRRRKTFTFLLIAALGVAALAERYSPLLRLLVLFPVKTERVKTTSFDISSAGRPIPVEAFEPEGEASRGTVIMLYGSNGMTGPEMYHEFSIFLAQHGYAVYLPDYFAAAGKSDSADHWEAWSAAVKDTAAEALKRSGREKAALVGFSLGSTVALVEAQTDPRIGGVVEFFGGLPAELRTDVGRLPPTLILHGTGDASVSANAARELDRLLSDNGVAHETKLYRGKPHGFIATPDYAAWDAEARVLAFLAERLK